MQGHIFVCYEWHMRIYMGEQSDKNTVHSANVLFVSAICRAARNHTYVLIIVQQK